MKKLMLVAVLTLVVLASVVVTAACKKNEEKSDLIFEVNFTKSILGEDYYVDSRIVKSVEELNVTIGVFEFDDVLQKYNENFFSSKSVVVFSFNISGSNQREIESIRLENSELVIKYKINNYPGTGGLYSEIIFIEVDKNCVAGATSIRGEL